MEKQIVFSKEVKNELNTIIFHLFEKDYFGFIEDAKKYADSIIDFIVETIPKNNYRLTPKPIQYISKYYIFYPKNKTTTWFVFFNITSKYIHITHISNNHLEVSKYLNI